MHCPDCLEHGPDLVIEVPKNIEYGRISPQHRLDFECGLCGAELSWEFQYDGMKFVYQLVDIKRKEKQ